MGYIHSIETMGTMDGPGLRMVVFFQGCPIRCLYCHNPDTRPFGKGQEMTVEEICRRAKSLRPYFARSGGGVTLSGGEPLAQPEFLVELLRALQKDGHCTVVDTSGVGNPAGFDDILAATDLVLLDLKHWDPETHRRLIGATLDAQAPFLDALLRHRTRLWVRHVMVPGYSDTPDAPERLTERIRPLLAQIERAEILPYHTLGESKYATLGEVYPLSGVPPMDREIAKSYERAWQEAILRAAREDGVDCTPAFCATVSERAAHSLPEANPARHTAAQTAGEPPVSANERTSYER